MIDRKLPEGTIFSEKPEPDTNYYVDEAGVLHIDNVKGYRIITEYVRNAIRDVCGDPQFNLSDEAWNELIKDAEK